MNITSISAIDVAGAALAVQQGEFTKIAESLASGLNTRIDPADEYISQVLNIDTKDRYTAIENAQQGMNLTDIASDSLSVVKEDLSRIKELSIQAANDTYSAEQREAMQAEINQLTNSINKTISSAKYNNIEVLNIVNDVNPDVADNINFQVGTGTSSQSEISYNPNIKMSEMNFDVSTSQNARATINTIDEMLTEVSSKQSEIAATQASLMSSVEQNSTAILNNQASYSQIQDTDYALSVVDLLKSKITQESLISVIKAGYQSQETVLNLITGTMSK